MTTPDTMSAAGEVALLDILNPNFRLDTPEVLAAREAHWWARTPIGAAVLRYAENDELRNDPRLRQLGLDVLAAQGVTEGPLVEFLRTQILHVEDETHARLRTLITRAFTPRRTEELRPVMREVAERLIDEFAADGACEFMAAFADRYPIRVICHLLDIPEDDADALAGWTDAIGLMYALPVQPHLPMIDAAIASLDGYTDRLVAQRRNDPGADLLSALITAEADGDRLDATELRSLVNALFIAGHDTTRCQLGSALRLFAEHPDQWALLAARPEHAAAAAEEVMRLAPAAPANARITRTKFTHRDLRLPAGALLYLCSALANTDPRVYGEAAAEFDITIKRPAQLQFGGGPHYCVGAHLARWELRETLPILARRLPGLTLAGEPGPRPYLGITGPQTLPITFMALS